MDDGSQLPALLERDAADDEIELSVVMPCLDEVETVGTCISKARHACESNAISYDVIVADNGSTDGSQELAAAEGASSPSRSAATGRR